MSARHLLISVLGTNPKDLLYELDGRTHEARLAPIALLKLSEKRFDEVIALCTKEAARDSLPLLERGTEDVRVTSVEVAVGVNEGDIGEFLAAFTKSVPEGSVVVVDVTHGFRHLSFLTLLGALYASTLGRAKVRSAYYALQRALPDPSPFIDLRPLLELTGFLHAARVLRERGDPQPLADVLGHPESHAQRAQGIVRGLTSISHAHASALPLELGRHAGLFLRDQLRPLRRALEARHLPLVDELLSQVSESLERFQLPIPSGQGWKRRTPLNVEELRRQARFIDELLERKSFGPALILMEEWVISWACLCLGLTSPWLDVAARAKAATTLHALVAVDAGALSAEQRELAWFWKALSEVRNAYAHAGMRGDEVEATLDERVCNGWQKLKHVPDLALEISAHSTAPVLVSAVGTTPGPLYSALRACPTDPGCLIAICSEETQPHAQRALTYAGSRARLIPITLVDPIGGTSEIDHVVKAAAAHLLEGPEVFVNLTGGTTLMGLAVERIAGEARRLGRPVRRFGLIDRRTREEQQADPFQTAEPYWLDSEGHNGGKDGR